MARMSLSQAAQSVAGKQPVQPVPLVSEPVYPYAGTRRLSPMPPVPGSNAVRIAPDGTRLSPPPPTPGSNAYRVAPAGTLYNYAGQRDGRAMGVPYGPGAYPVINTHNPTMVVLPPRLDLFSHMQNDYANFYRNIMPLITQMSQRAMQQGAKAARPKGTGGPVKPKAPKVEDLGSWNAYKPGVDMRGDRDSFTLRQPGIRPDYKIGVKPTDRSWWPNPTMESPAPAPAPKSGTSSDVPAGNTAVRPSSRTAPTPKLPVVPILRPRFNPDGSLGIEVPNMFRPPVSQGAAGSPFFQMMFPPSNLPSSAR